MQQVRYNILIQRADGDYHQSSLLSQSLFYYYLNLTEIKDRIPSVPTVELNWSIKGIYIFEY